MHTTDITRLLERLDKGDRSAFDRMIPLVYDNLRQIARQQLGRCHGTLTLGATTLAHEAYLRLAERTGLGWENRDHFLAVCSVVMRNLIVDIARARQAAKRWGGLKRVEFEETNLALDDQAEDVIALDEALAVLADIDPTLVRVVECRFFAGLTEPETARVLDMSERTVRRAWVKAKALLHGILEPEAGDVPGQGARASSEPPGSSDGGSSRLP